MELIDFSSETTVRRRYVDDCIIVYLDVTLDQGNITQLSQLGFSMESLTDEQQCLDFITNVQETKIICVITDQLIEGSILVFNYLPLVTFIYVIGTNAQTHKSYLTEKYPKMKGISSTLSSITESIMKNLQITD